MTLLQNGGSYLFRHIKQVIGQLEEAGVPAIGAIGIKHRVDEFYSLSETVQSPESLPEASLRLLEKLLAKACSVEMPAD